MHKSKYLILFFILLLSTASCSSENDSPENKKHTETTVNPSIEFLINNLNSLDSSILMDSSTKEQIISNYQLTDFEEGEDFIKNELDFEGVSLNRKFSFSNNGLQSITIQTYYDVQENIKTDFNKISSLLNKKFGEKNDNEWESDDYVVSANLFKNGYSIYIDSYIYYEMMDLENSEGCLGDLDSLSSHLSDVILDRIIREEIIIGSTSEENLSNYFDDPSIFTINFDGINLNGFCNFNNTHQLTQISLDYFYNDCEISSSILENDQKVISQTLNNYFNIQNSTTSESQIWTFKETQIIKKNYSDGYSIVFELKNNI